MTKTDNNSIRRSPVIAIMGHIDHGKSTLLDYIRKTNIVSGEAGGITQHLSAYEVNHKGADGNTSKITFLDTPGHEAFSAIRSRGVNVADIAILVVSAEDGVKPQTLEALECIKQEGIPYIVAINKIDKPGANVDKTKQSLMDAGVYVEGWGGNIPSVPISAKTGEGVSDLLDMMLLVAELEDLKGNTEILATGSVIESNLDQQKGIASTLIIKDGTLKTGMFVASGDAMSPVRIMENFLGEKIDEAHFSTPVSIIGWSKLPKAGSLFFSFETKKEAENFVFENKEAEANQKPQSNANTEGKKVIPLIIKTDSAGSSDAVINEIAKIKCDERMCTNIVYSDVGGINESDIKAATGNEESIVLAFHTKADAKALALAERTGILVKQFNIIYELTDWLKTELENRKPISETEEITGKAKILKTFSKTKDLQLIGGRVVEGVLKVGSSVKVIRNEEEVGKGTIKGAQQQKTETDTLSDGEFGMMIQSKIDILPGDFIAPFQVVKK